MPLEGALAQLGERRLCKAEVVGSIPTGSMRFVTMTRTPAAAVSAALALILAACGDTEIDEGKVERLVRDNLAGPLGRVDCPGGVKAEKGKTFECKVESPGHPPAT